MANMHVSEIGRQVPPPPVPDESNPVAQVSAALLRAQAFTGATGVALLVKEDENLVCHAATGTGAPDFGARVPVEGTFLGLSVRSKKAERSEDADTDLRVENATYGRVKPKSILVVPVRSGQDVTGVLAVFATTAGVFNNTHVAILRTMSDALARIVALLPPMPPTATISPAATESEKKAETVIAMPAPKQAPQASAPEPKPTPAPEPRVLKMPEPVPAPAAPEPRKAEGELLTLADDPGPRVTLRTLPALERPIEPPKFTTQSPFFDVPRPSRRRRRMRNRMIAGAVLLFATTFGYGAYATRTQSAPPAKFAQPAVPEMFKEQANAVQAAQTKVSLAAQAVAAKPTASPADVVVAATVIEKPAPVRTPAANIEIKPLAATEKPAEVEAPQLAMSTTPAMPAIGLGLGAPKPELRQAQITRPQLVQKVAPEYPIGAVRARAAGEVKLTAVVRKDGSVGEVKVINGHPLLRDSAVAAVRQWRYYPGTLDGHAIESTAEITLKFAAPK